MRLAFHGQREVGTAAAPVSPVSPETTTTEVIESETVGAQVRGAAGATKRQARAQGKGDATQPRRVSCSAPGQQRMTTLRLLALR